MGSVNVGHLFRKRTVRNLAGQIVDMVDESDGGVIIRRGQVVNEEKVIELNKKEEDRKIAAVASTMQAEVPLAVAEERSIGPSKFKEMEDRITAQDAKLDAILAALKK